MLYWYKGSDYLLGVMALQQVLQVIQGEEYTGMETFAKEPKKCKVFLRAQM